MGWDVKATRRMLSPRPFPSPPTLPNDYFPSLRLRHCGDFRIAFLALAVAASTDTAMHQSLEDRRDVPNRDWQLALLGSAALLLSLAGGWTTWDGMKNFTGEPVLSAMFTFGIHGVMLIVAWLIGESFATGMNQMAGPNTAPGQPAPSSPCRCSAASSCLRHSWRR